MWSIFKLTPDLLFPGVLATWPGSLATPLTRAKGSEVCVTERKTAITSFRAPFKEGESLLRETAEKTRKYYSY